MEPEIKADVPQIPVGWSIINVGDHFNFKNGLNKSKQFFGQGTPIVNFVDVYKNRHVRHCDLRGLVTVTEKEIRSYEVRKGDVFFLRTSETVDEIGLTSVAVEDFRDTVFSGFVLRARPVSDRIETNFKRFCFSPEYVRKQIIQGSSYTTRALTNGRALGKIALLVPEATGEQTAIATALSDMDDLINSLERLIEKKKAIKQAVMQELLRAKQGWRKVKLKEIATIQRGASPRPIDSPLWFDETSSVGWVRISDVTSSEKYLTSTTQKLSSNGIKNSRYVAAGELIMSICATIGRPILTRIDTCIHDGFVAFYNPDVDREFLYYYLCFIEDDWSKSGQTGSQMNLNTEIIGSKDCYYPEEIETQREIASILATIDEEMKCLVDKVEKYVNVKKGMMQQLLTGKIRLV